MPETIWIVLVATIGSYNPDLMSHDVYYEVDTTLGWFSSMKEAESAAEAACGEYRVTYLYPHS